MISKANFHAVFSRVMILLMTCAPAPVLAEMDRPRLVLQITVDGMRADLLERYSDRFGTGGFRRLIDTGIWYRDAHHLHANTETIVGHATLATGAHPSEHGMIGNAWFDRDTGTLRYNIEDADYTLLPVAGMVAEGEQLDPTQAAAVSDGRSPRALLVTTFGDELFKSNNGQSKVFAVSGKDRSAVAMAGHVGKAFWMSAETGAYVTSTYYYDAYPEWVAKWNTGHPADAFAETDWQLMNDPATYLLLDNDDRPYETDLKGFGRTFPHTYADLGNPIYYTQVVVSPNGDQLTADFGKALIENEKLGTDIYPDFLGISFSGVDAVNHFFGPSSLENEETVLRLDAILSDFLEYVDATVGLDHTVVVLSADHGMPEMPEYMTEQGFEATRNYTEDLRTGLNEAAKTEFGVDEAVRFFFRPYLYLDYPAIAAAGVDRRIVETFLAARLGATPGISFAMPTTPLPGQMDSVYYLQVKRNYHPERSGDIYVAQSPYSFLFEKGAIAAMHGSPWLYDTHVPVIFSTSSQEPTIVERRIGTVDVATTLSSLMGINRPSSAAGTILEEVLREK